MAADLSRVEEMDRLATEVLARVPHLDILVNNAGSSKGRANFWEISHADAEWTMNVNWTATFVLSQYVARQMMERQIRGRIVNISTIGAHYNHRDALVYNAAKAAIEATTRNMAYELGPYGISVNCVAPGMMAERPGARRNEERWREQAEAHIPLKRVGKARTSPLPSVSSACRRANTPPARPCSSPVATRCTWRAINQTPLGA